MGCSGLNLNQLIARQTPFLLWPRVKGRGRRGRGRDEFDQWVSLLRDTPGWGLKVFAEAELHWTTHSQQWDYLGCTCLEKGCSECPWLCWRFPIDPVYGPVGGITMVSPCDLWSGRMSYCSPVVNPPDLGSGQTSCYSFTAPTKWSVKLWPTLLLGEVQTAWFLPPAILPLRILRLSRGKPDMILSKISLFLFIFCKS